MTVIEALRRKHGLTQAELAEQLGVSRMTVSNWESGKFAPQKSKRAKICEVLHCSPADLTSVPSTTTTTVEFAQEKNVLTILVVSVTDSTGTVLGTVHFPVDAIRAGMRTEIPISDGLKVRLSAE